MKITSKEIELYLKDIKFAVQKDRYRIAYNRKRYNNVKLFDDYIISENKVKEILLSLEITDFSEKRQNEHIGFEQEVLYIFGKDVELIERYGTNKKKVSLYIKFNKLDNCFVIVISFHEQKYPLKYYFK